MNESHYDQPLPWQRAEWADAQDAHDALLALATRGRDTVEALAWLGRFDETDSETRVTVRSALRARLTDAEWPTYMVWREQTAAHLVPVMVAKHSRGPMGLVRLAEGRQTGIPSKEKSASLPCTSPIDAGVAA